MPTTWSPSVYLSPIAGSDDLARPVLERLDSGTELLVTTRLDNDDALHEDAIAVIRHRVRNRPEFLNLRLGFFTDGARARVMNDKYGSFTTFVEPVGRDPLRTVYCTPHPKQWRVAPVRQIAGRPLWLRVIHTRNAANKGFGDRRDYDFRNPRQLEAWFRHHVLKPVRRWFWPEAHRREYRLEEIAGAFHIGDLPNDCPLRTE